MSLLENVKRIRREDFKDEDQETIDGLAFILNRFMTQVVDTVNGNIDYANIKHELKTFTVEVDANGIPKKTTKIKVTASRIAGTVVIKYKNLTNLGTYPTSGPTISFTNNIGFITIDHVTGLQADEQYQLTVECKVE
jgi:hypothetical protein